MDRVIENVMDFAAKAHGDQQRKYVAEDYIHHPIRVMETCRNYTSSIPVLCAALLHDVLEDTPVTKEEMFDFLLTVMKEKEAKRTVAIVTELTDVYIKSSYPNLNRRSRKNKELDRLVKISPEAQTIKYADIIDNVKAIGSDDNDFAPVYLKECNAILKRLDKGDPVLYNQALETIEKEMEEL